MYRNIPILYRVMESFFRYRSLFLISAVVVTTIPAAILLTRKPTYNSTAMVQVISTNAFNITGETNNNPTWSTVSQANVNHFNDWMSDDSPGGFVDQALQQANLTHPINVDPRVKDPRLAQLRKGLSLASVSDTVFTINLSWDNATECEQLVKALQNQYIEETGREKQTESTRTLEFLDGELKSYNIRLHAAEKNVIDFKTKNQGQSEGAQANAIQELSQLQIQLNDLEVSSHNNEIKATTIQQRLAKIKPTSIKTSHTTSKESPLQLQKDGLEASRNQLLAAGWLPTSTRVLALETQIKSLQHDIEGEVKANPNSSKNVDETVEDNPEYRELQSLLNDATINKGTEQAQMAQLRQRIAGYKDQIARLPGAEAMLNDRMRDYNILKTQYDELLKRREQAILKKNLDKVAATAPLHAIGNIYAQSTNGKAKTALLLFGLLIFGLILGIGVTVLAEWADPSVRFASDVQRRLGVPVLISLPELAPLHLVTSSSSSSSDKEKSGGRPLLSARDE